MGKRIECEVRAAKVPFNGQMIDGVEVTCTDCDHVETAGGTSEKSVKRCLAMMRENCPEGEDNYYVSDDE